MIKKKKLRKEIIESKLNDVIESISIVSDNFPDNFVSFENSGLVKDGIYKKIEFAIDSIIDICYIINSDLRLGTPEEEEDIFDNLKSNKIFKRDIISLIKEMKGFRNILVHKYGKIDDKKAFETMKEEMKDFEKIIKETEMFLKKHK